LSGEFVFFFFKKKKKKKDQLAAILPPHHMRVAQPLTELVVLNLDTAVKLDMVAPTTIHQTA
jgi:hypothetical protein